ncbi:MAG: hypothetical protein OCD01_14075 [Fibrobacterales bacterium]
MRYFVYLFVILPALFLGCLDANTSDQNSQSSDDQSAHNEEWELELLIGSIDVDEIVLTIETDGNESEIVVDDDIDGEDKIFIPFEAVLNTEVTLSYICMYKDEITGAGMIVVDLVEGVELSSTPDEPPVFVEVGSDTTIYVGERYSFSKARYDDNSSQIVLTYRFMEDAEFGSEPEFYYEKKGTYEATIKIFDGFTEATHDVTITVKEYSHDGDENDSSGEEKVVYDVTYESLSGGEISGESTVMKGESISLTHTTNDGYQFEEYLINEGTATLDDDEVSDVESDVGLGALFTVLSYKILITVEGDCGSVITEDSYTYSVESDPVEIGVDVDDCSVQFMSDDVTFKQNSITAITESGFEKSNRELEVAAVFSEVAIPSADITVECYLDGEQQSNCNGEFGSVSPESFTLYENANSKTLITSANTGYALVGLTDSENVILDGNKVSYVTAGEDGVVHAVFKRNEYRVTLSDDENGAVAGSVPVFKHGVEESFSLSVSENNGYDFDRWVVTGCSLSDGYEGNKSQVKMTCTGDGALTARFSKTQVTGVSLNVNSGTMVLNDGSTLALTATIYPDSAFDKNVSWSTSVAGVVTVTSGDVAAVGIGESVVSVKTSDGDFTASTTITIGSFKDIRDGQVYKAKKIGGLIWMIENLNYTTPDSSFCYDNDVACDNTGRLYGWNAANIACPSGWRVPTDPDFRTLGYLVSGGADPHFNINGPYDFGDNWDEGLKLMSTSGWPINGTDDVGFSGKPGGFRRYDGNYYEKTTSGYWWSSSTPTGFTHAVYWGLFSATGYFSEDSKGVNQALSVRCVGI